VKPSPEYPLLQTQVPAAHKALAPHAGSQAAQRNKGQQGPLHNRHAVRQPHIRMQISVLQDSVSVALPGQPAKSPKHVRLRVRIPPPHVTLQAPVVHSDHPDAGSPCTNSGGQI
jgi:hypothetical protein